MSANRYHVGLDLGKSGEPSALAVLTSDDVTLWRQGSHDDLIYAVALAAWGGECDLRMEGRQPKRYVHQ